MAKTSSLFLVLSILLLISASEARLFNHKFTFAKDPVPKAPTCFIVYGVKSGDTCAAVQKEFGVSAEVFTAINPNLVCETLFVGQWLCVDGSA